MWFGFQRFSLIKQNKIHRAFCAHGCCITNPHWLHIFLLFIRFTKRGPTVRTHSGVWGAEVGGLGVWPVSIAQRDAVPTSAL